MLKLTSRFIANFLIFSIFIQENGQNCNANDKCSNLKLKSTEKLHIQLYYQAGEDKDLIYIVCEAMRKFKNLLAVEFKTGALAKKNGDVWTCPNDNNCDSNRYELCLFAKMKKPIDVCNGISITRLERAECFCGLEIDKTLQKNASGWASYQLSDDKVPTLILNGKWDPCLDISSVEAFQKYVAKIYK